MSLSFREQAVIAQMVAGVRNFPSALDDAQKAADACCKVWGHTYVTDRGVARNDIANECQRCGEKK